MPSRKKQVVTASASASRQDDQEHPLALDPRVARWFVATAIICFLDASFVLLRPRTFTGGDINQMFPVYRAWSDICSKHDKRYADLDDAIIYLQSWLNLVEITLGLLCIVMSRNWRLHKEALILAIVVSICTAYKTVIYLSVEIFEKPQFKFVGHQSLASYFFNVFLFSSFWIIIPALVVKRCFDQLTKN